MKQRQYIMILVNGTTGSCKAERNYNLVSSERRVFVKRLAVGYICLRWAVRTFLKDFFHQNFFFRTFLQPVVHIFLVLLKRRESCCRLKTRCQSKGHFFLPQTFPQMLLLKIKWNEKHSVHLKVGKIIENSREWQTAQATEVVIQPTSPLKETRKLVKQRFRGT